MELTTERLQLRDAEAEDLEHVHRAFSSNPDFLELRPDIAAAGGYDLASVRRYWEGAQFDRVRHVLVVLDGETDETVGLIDFVTESPADGYPWIGLVLVDRDRQRHGIGTEAVGAVAAHLRQQGHAVVRMAVMEGNEAGLAFARSAGFEAVADAPTMGPRGRVLLMELDLSVPLGHEQWRAGTETTEIR
jgi:RimJ/RimL family protein N-acetyltransferase